MGRNEKAKTRSGSDDKPLPTIWEVPDDAWEKIEAILLDVYPPEPRWFTDDQRFAFSTRLHSPFPPARHFEPCQASTTHLCPHT